MNIEQNLLKKLESSPIPLLDLTTEEHNIIEGLIKSNKVVKFIDNGSCNYPISTLHSEAYYVKLS